MIRNKVVVSGACLRVPAHLSVGEYFLERILQNCDREGDAVALILGLCVYWEHSCSPSKAPSCGGDVCRVTLFPQIWLRRVMAGTCVILVIGCCLRVAGLLLVNGDTGEEVTFSQLLQQTVNVAVGLKQLGVRRGDVVALYSESKNEVVSWIVGALCCGATLTVYSTLYNKDELEHVINISNPTVVICSHAVLMTQMNVLKATESIKHIVQINGDLTEGVLSYYEVLANTDPRTYEPEAVSGASDIALIVYSSGTTGLPKGVMISHLNILYAVAILDLGHFVEVSNRIMSVLPWYHVYGLLTTIHYLTCHKKVVYLTGFKPDKYLSCIQKYKVNGLLVVPPIVVFLAKSPLVQKYDLSSVKCFLCSAAPLNQQTANDVKKVFPNLETFVQGYGMTETTLGVLKEADEVGGKPGYLPIPGCRLKVVDTVTGEKLGPNKEGEICVKGPGIMKGYKDNEAATKASFDEEGYLKTGDIGYYDEKGCFSIVDRLKEIIKYKGHQVAPATIEGVILQHIAVADCAVLGVPDDMAGELPIAFVVLKRGFDVTEQELIEFTNAKVSPLARIRGGIKFVDQIPKSAAGKMLRRVLKQKFLS